MKKSFPNVSFKDLCLLIQSNAILHVGNGNFNEEDGLGVEKKINKKVQQFSSHIQHATKFVRIFSFLIVFPFLCAFHRISLLLSLTTFRPITSISW